MDKWAAARPNINDDQSPVGKFDDGAVTLPDIPEIDFKKCAGQEHKCSDNRWRHWPHLQFLDDDRDLPDRAVARVGGDQEMGAGNQDGKWLR